MQIIVDILRYAYPLTYYYYCTTAHVKCFKFIFIWIIASLLKVLYLPKSKTQKKNNNKKQNQIMQKENKNNYFRFVSNNESGFSCKKQPHHQKNMVCP